MTCKRMESLWDITDDDAIAEGVTLDGAVVGHDFNIDGEWWAGGPRNQFRRLWDRINGRGSHAWAYNPDVWVYDFEVLPQ
ncbi:MAG: hypothetical protein KDA21_01450 [Phycisphaerales bacterium]|nr:hypothetical protein [Phycisphaerales bacterium]